MRTAQEILGHKYYEHNAPRFSPLPSRRMRKCVLLLTKLVKFKARGKCVLFYLPNQTGEVKKKNGNFCGARNAAAGLLARCSSSLFSDEESQGNSLHKIRLRRFFTLYEFSQVTCRTTDDGQQLPHTLNNRDLRPTLQPRHRDREADHDDKGNRVACPRAGVSNGLCQQRNR